MLDRSSLLLATSGKAPRTRFAILPREYFLPPLPNEFCDFERFDDPRQETFESLAARIRLLISNSEDNREKAALEQAALQWLYSAVRRNILRGRVFELQRMMTEKRADCLGYARLFQILGSNLGLDIGMAEVIVDNAGRCVPHFVNIVRLSDGTTRFTDAWYGSTDILHRRMGLQVTENHRWVLKDVEANELQSFLSVRGIPPRCVYATILFVLGNRHLENSLSGKNDTELDRALRYYDTAIALYPENPRFYFNRAIAFDNKGLRSEAERDYRSALADEEKLLRVLARQHEEVVGLISLDEKGITERDQRLYLWHKGFATGSPTTLPDVANQNNLKAEEVEEIIKRVEAALMAS